MTAVNRSRDTTPVARLAYQGAVLAVIPFISSTLADRSSLKLKDSSGPAQKNGPAQDRAAEQGTEGEGPSQEPPDVDWALPELDDGADDPLPRPELEEFELDEDPDEPEPDVPEFDEPELDVPEFDVPELWVPDDEPVDPVDVEPWAEDVLVEPGSVRTMAPAVTTLARANPSDAAQFVYVRQADATSTATASTHLALNTDQAAGYTDDDASPALTYAGDWTHAGPSASYTAGDYDSTESWSTQAGASVSATFTGTAVQWIGPKNTNGGIADVYLDGTLAGTVDTYAAAGKEFQQVLFSQAGLAAGSHTLTISVTGTQNPAASADTVVVDAINVPTAAQLADYYPVVPQQGSITLEGRDSRLLVANYDFGGQHLVYATSELMTQASIGGQATALLYDPAGTDGETVLRYASQPAVSGPKRMSWAAPGEQNASTRAASCSSASRSRTGPNSSMVSVAASRLLASRHIPATNPSMSTEPGMMPLTVESRLKSARLTTRDRSACDRIRLSNSATRRTGAGTSAPGRGAAGRSNSSAPCSSRNVSRDGRSRSSTALSPVSPDQAWTSRTVAGPNAPRYRVTNVARAAPEAGSGACRGDWTGWLSQHSAEVCRASPAWPQTARGGT